MPQFEGLPPDSPVRALDEESVRTIAAALWRRSPKVAACMDEAAFVERKLSLYLSVETLLVSGELKEHWRQAVLSDAALRQPAFFARCAAVGRAMSPASLRRGFREPDNSSGVLLGLFRLLGRAHVEAARKVFGPDWDEMADDERLAVTARTVEVLLDIYPALAEDQKRIAERLERVSALAVDEASRLFEELSRPAAPRSRFAMNTEEMAEELAALEFTHRLIRAGLDARPPQEPDCD